MKQQLALLLERNLIDEQIIQIVLTTQQRLANYWLVDIHTPPVEMLLIHLANALGRIKRNYCASALQKEFLAEIKSAVIFPKVLAIHNDLLGFIPFPIPENEQTYFLANIHLLVKIQNL